MVLCEILNLNKNCLYNFISSIPHLAVHFKNLNVTYSLSTDTWICIYLIVVNKHVSFYLAALTHILNILYLHHF